MLSRSSLDILRQRVLFKISNILGISDEALNLVFYFLMLWVLWMLSRDLGFFFRRLLPLPRHRRDGAWLGGGWVEDL